MSEELKPCPFCGDRLKSEGPDSDFYTHPKSECHFSEWEFPCMSGDNLEKWNRRAASTRTASDTRTAAGEAECDAAMLAAPASQHSALVAALLEAECALADIGDADRDPRDDVAWCEARAAKALPRVRAALAPFGKSKPAGAACQGGNTQPEPPSYAYGPGKSWVVLKNPMPPRDFAARTQADAGKAEPEAKQLAHGHRDDFYLMANARLVAELPIHRVTHMPNWVFASELFATGSTSAHQICIDAGIDPDGYKIERHPPTAKPENT